MPTFLSANVGHASLSVTVSPATWLPARSPWPWWCRRRPCCWPLAVTVIARAVITPVVLAGEGHGVVVAAVAVVDRSAPA